MDADVEELVGEVEAVIFANDSTGFGVVELAGDGDADGARAAGPLAGLVTGQPVRLLGRWGAHEKYGPTFAAVAYEHAEPRSTAALEAFDSIPFTTSMNSSLRSKRESKNSLCACSLKNRCIGPSGSHENVRDISSRMRFPGCSSMNLSRSSRASSRTHSASLMS